MTSVNMDDLVTNYGDDDENGIDNNGLDLLSFVAISQNRKDSHDDDYDDDDDDDDDDDADDDENIQGQKSDDDDDDDDDHHDNEEEEEKEKEKEKEVVVDAYEKIFQNTVETMENVSNATLFSNLAKQLLVDGLTSPMFKCGHPKWTLLQDYKCIYAKRMSSGVLEWHGLPWKEELKKTTNAQNRRSKSQMMSRFMGDITKVSHSCYL